MLFRTHVAKQPYYGSCTSSSPTRLTVRPKGLLPLRTMLFEKELDGEYIYCAFARVHETIEEAAQLLSTWG